jgi:murein DD-endopeptidase MepM/ murein hydrolase activator NlpD
MGLQAGTYYARVTAPSISSRQTNYKLVLNLTGEYKPDNYFDELATWSDDQWDWAAGDNTRITGPFWPGERDETNYQNHQAVLQIYNDLTRAILGKTYRSSAGYVQDPSYFNSEGQQYGWHSGIDIDTDNGVRTNVKALVGGTASVVQRNAGNQFLEIAGDDGRFYRYGHLSALKVLSGRVNQGDVIGELGMSSASNHLHFQVNETQNRPTGYNSKDKNKVYQWTLNPLKVFWELKREGRI